MSNRFDIRDWAATNSTPDQDYCPHLLQYWRDSAGHKILWDNRTGKRSMEFPNTDDYQQMSVKKEYYGLYVKYISELDVLELASVMLEGNRGVAGVPKDWTYGSWDYRTYKRLFIVKGTTTCYDENGYEIIAGKKYVNEAVKGLLHMMTSTMSNRQAGKQIGLFMKGSLSKEREERFENNNWYTPYYVMTWYDDEFMERTRSNKANALLEYELEDDVEIKSAGDMYNNYLVFQKLDDEYAVIRVYHAEMNNKWNPTTREYEISNIGFKEFMRCFISKKGKPTVMQMSYGKWAVTSSMHYWANYKTYTVNREEFATWTPLKYIMPVLEEPTIQDIVQMLRHPVVEQMVKAGFPKTAKKIKCGNEIANCLKIYYGVEKERKLPLFKLLGVNKWLMQKEEELTEETRWGCNRSQFIKDVKELYGRFDISDLSKETVELLANAYKVATFREMVGRSSGWYRHSSYSPFDVNEHEEVLKLCRREQKHEGWIATYKDCKNMLRYIEEVPDIELEKVDKMSDLVRIHDALVDIQIREREEREARYNERRREELEQRKKKFEKENEERIARFDYEEANSDFIIRTPRELEEITKEGIALHHCVGGYVDRHAEGYTNILFLRKKDDAMHSFYTIEIKNDKLIQIHGACNKWLGNDPEAIPFVYRYLKQLGISFDKDILLNKGAGYSRSEESLPESYLTAA